MAYQFYPRRGDACPNVGHCPHAGGAAIASLIMGCNDNELYHQYLHGTIDAERKHNRSLSDENERLTAELAQVKLELKLERQNKFTTNKQKQADPTPEPEAEKLKRKRGAPVGLSAKCDRDQLSQSSQSDRRDVRHPLQPSGPAGI
jgi:hypothetical protein